MDIKTAMALRNYGINPHNASQTKNKTNSSLPDFNLDKLENNKSIDGIKKQDFSTVMKNLATESMSSLKNAEQTALDGINNKADVQSVVEAMAQAEMTVKTVTAVRDKVVEAYQEILRMPM